jgi:hypothetical protein
MTEQDIYNILHRERVTYKELMKAIDTAGNMFYEEGKLVVRSLGEKRPRKATVRPGSIIRTGNIALIGFSYALSVSKTTRTSRVFNRTFYDGPSQLIGFL